MIPQFTGLIYEQNIHENAHDIIIKTDKFIVTRGEENGDYNFPIQAL